MRQSRGFLRFSIAGIFLSHRHSRSLFLASRFQYQCSWRMHFSEIARYCFAIMLCYHYWMFLQCKGSQKIEIGFFKRILVHALSCIYTFHFPPIQNRRTSDLDRVEYTIPIHLFPCVQISSTNPFVSNITSFCTPLSSFEPPSKSP